MGNVYAPLFPEREGGRLGVRLLVPLHDPVLALQLRELPLELLCGRHCGAGQRRARARRTESGGANCLRRTAPDQSEGERRAREAGRTIALRHGEAREGSGLNAEQSGGGRSGRTLAWLRDTVVAATHGDALKTEDA